MHAPRKPLVGILLVCFLATAAAAEDVDEIVRQVQARYDATRDFRANLTQETVIASLSKTVTSRGTIAFKKPGRLRLEITDGEVQTVVADGTTLWLYQPDESQVLKAPFQAAFRSATPISFLTGVGRIADDFNVQLDGSDEGRKYLMLTPRRSDGDVGKLRLTVSSETFEIQGAEIHDPLGNIVRLRFAEIRRNSDPSDDLFRFDVPDGVDVISAPSSRE